MWHEDFWDSMSADQQYGERLSVQIEIQPEISKVKLLATKLKNPESLVYEAIKETRLPTFGFHPVSSITPVQLAVQPNENKGDSSD